MKENKYSDIDRLRHIIEAGNQIVKYVEEVAGSYEIL